MDLLTLLLTSVALSMDCFAVALAGGASIKSSHVKTALLAGLFFGVFQAGMTVLGWSAGAAISAFLLGAGPVIATVILAGVGVKMILEVYRETREEDEAGEEPVDISGLPTLFVLAIATSIDALAAGLGMAVISTGIILTAFVIGTVAALFSILGVMLGGRLALTLGRRAEVAGGVILILIGVRILAEYVFA